MKLGMNLCGKRCNRYNIWEEKVHNMAHAALCCLGTVALLDFQST